MGTSGISSGSIDALRVQLMKMNSQQLQAFAQANQDDAIKLGLAAEADKYRKQHAQEAMAMMSGQQQKLPIAQQILQSIGQPPQQPQQPMLPHGQGMPSQGQMPPQGMRHSKWRKVKCHLKKCRLKAWPVAVMYYQKIKELPRFQLVIWTLQMAVLLLLQMVAHLMMLWLWLSLWLEMTKMNQILII
jgi:hypothetical protein